MQEKMDPIQVLDALTEAIREVGDGFGKGELFLPELVGAANAMQKATPILEEEIKKSGARRESVGRVVIGSVYGDMHNIGKTMVCTLLTADGFEVIDLGISGFDIPRLSSTELFEQPCNDGQSRGGLRAAFFERT
ncbi:MAG: B12-binding domain-containing protein, partial [Anaerolineales bacterium]